MLSAIVITRNEENNIRRCLNSLRLADEIIVVDSGSEDKTPAIASSLGAKVFHQAWHSYGQQKNFGANAAQGDWLLFIDADEEVTPSLQKEIQAVTATQLPDSKYDIYWLRIITIFLGQKLTHLYGHNPRLLKKGHAHWTDAAVHEQVIRANGQPVRLGDSDTGLIITPLLHFSHTSLKSYLKKMHYYTDLDAKQMAETRSHRSGWPVKTSFTLPPYLALRQLVKLLFYRRGILDGYAGWIWCVLSAYYEWEMASKFVRLTNIKSKVQNPIVQPSPKGYGRRGKSMSQ